MAEKDVLAVCVLVTSDDSSSDSESHGGSRASSVETYEKEHQQLDPTAPSDTLSRHSSLREAPSGFLSPQDHQESKAMHALQRAKSLRASTSSKYPTPSCRRKFQSNLMPENNRVALLPPPRDASPFLSPSSSSPSPSPPPSSDSSISENVSEASSPPQVTAYNPPLQISRGHFSPSNQSCRKQIRAHEAPTEMPVYLPHHTGLEQEDPYLRSLGQTSFRNFQPPIPDGRQEAGAGSHHGVQQPTRVEDSRWLKLPPHAREKQEPGNWSTECRVGDESGPEPAAGKKTGLKKLLLTEEQKSSLLDWNDALPESVNPGPMDGQSKKGPENWGRGQVLKPECPLLSSIPRKPQPGPRDDCEKSLAEQNVPAERTVTPPKSPLQFFANAFRNFFPSSDSVKKAGAKPEARSVAASQPHMCARALSLRATSSTKEWNKQSPDRASSLYSWSTPTARTAQPTYPNPMDSSFYTRSLPNRASKTAPIGGRPQSSRLEDVPTSLLERVTLQETFPDKKRNFFSSLRHKDRPSEYIFPEPRQRKELGEILLSSTFGNALPPARSQPQEKLVQPLRSTRLGCRIHPEGNASPQHLPMSNLKTEPLSSSSTASSADEEFDPLSSSQTKERKKLKRRRKLDKETKQLAKQAELKRLYKAQAIQRQLEEVEEQQRALEIQGVRLEKALRGEANSGTQDEAQLLQEWFKLVLEKNKLMRYESELLIMAQELELEDHQSRLEQKLREKLFKEESQKDEKARNEEQAIINEMMQVIEQRDRLVDSLEEQRIKEKAEDQRFESFVFSMGCQLSRT